MSIESEENSFLFAVIAPARRKPEQVARLSKAGELPTYTLLREPFSLEEIFEYGPRLAIWRDNETITYVKPCNTLESPVLDASQRSVLLEFDKDLSIEIVGKTDDAIAETAAFFMGLEKPTEERPDFGICLSLGTGSFDFHAAGSQCFKPMFDVAPSRDVSFCDVTLSAEQSTALATRSHSTDLSFVACEFEDGGTAFVEALANRQSSFGTLRVDGDLLLTNENMKRLFQVKTIDHLHLSFLDDKELAVLAFSAQVESLDYEIELSSLSDADVQSLNIATRQLLLDVHYTSKTFPTDTALSLFRRVAEIGHFIELRVAFIYTGAGHAPQLPDCFIQELIRSAYANSHLQVLDLCHNESSLLAPHLGTLLNGLKDHKGLRTIKTFVNGDAFGRNYSHLRHLLSHNRYITVITGFGRRYTDGGSIDELYSLNHFYRGSRDLAVGPPSERPSLVATTLVKTASNDFQRSALLLSYHIDALCELVQFAKLEDPPSQSIRGATLKRKRDQWEANAEPG